MNYSAEIENLPIFEHLDKICETLKQSKSRFMILEANTGAGKSTALPLALLNHFSGNICMLEPRRISVLNVAYRVADLLGESVGETCGYSIHLDNKISKKTRFTVMTEAILTRKIQNDPSLTDVNVIVLDEFHERSIHADLALAFLKEVMAIRDDLYVVVMSATIDIKKVQLYLGGTDCCPIYSVPGKLYPVEILYKKDLTMVQAIKQSLETIKMGTVLCFLPGIGEIRRVQSDLGTVENVDVEILHSSVPIEKQKSVLKKVTDGKKKVILSSAIAETSLTVPDVCVVIDSGYSRVTEFNQNVGMEKLVTKRVSLFSANQRAGRAGRTQNGLCIRLWGQHEKLVTEQSPEFLRADLSSLVLECAEWGVVDSMGLDWLDNPSNGSWESAVELLSMLGCLKDKKITPLGQASLSLGIHPRLACVVLSGLNCNKIELSTALAVEFLLTDQTNQQTHDLYVENLKKRVQNFSKKTDLFTGFANNPQTFSTSYALLCGFPDRLAVQISMNSPKYKFPSGRIASLVDNPKSFSKYLVAPEVDAGESEGKIYTYEFVDTDLAEKFMWDRCETRVQIFLDEKNHISKNEVVSYGKITLKEKRVQINDGDYTIALCEKIKKEGLESVPLSKKAKDFLLRVQFFIENESITHNQSTISDKLKNLSQTADEWLSPFLLSNQSVTETVVYEALYYYLDGESVKKFVPTELILSNGKKQKIVYENQSGEIVPTIEIIIQQLFGCFTTPKIMGVPVLFKLLSPARRPLQITKDLENFWTNTWPEICTEMKGRYPKHNWDYRTVVS